MTESKSHDAAVGVAIGVVARPDQESPLAAEKTDEPTVTAGTDKAAVDIAGTTISTSNMMTDGSINSSGKAAISKGDELPAVGVPSPPKSHQDTPNTNSRKEEMEQINRPAAEEIQDPDASAIDLAMEDIAGASMSKTAMAHGTSTNSNKTAAQPVISKREGMEGVRIHNSSSKHDPLAASMQPEVQPLPLRRSAQQQLAGSPGAFATNTGINFQQQQPQALPTTTSTGPSPWPDENSSQFLCPSNNNYLSGSDDGLVEAIPVLEEEEERDPENNVMAEAQEIDIQELQERKAAREADRKRKERNCRKMGVGMVLLCILVVAAIILGVSLGNKKKKKNDSHTGDTTETLAPSEFLRSSEPSSTPSSAPTGPLDELMMQLPEYTLERLNRGSHEPQWKAWNWLANHPNITTTNLPEWRKMQLFALATFFYSFAGEHWNPLMKQRWMDYTMEECHWYSGGAGYFTEDGEYIEKPADQQLDPCNEMGEFVYLDVNGLELGGGDITVVLPREIVLLTSLVAINLNDNDVHAPLHAILPNELYYEMTSLTDLSFRVNQLTGTLPTELGLLTSLEQMNLFRNSLTGSVPSELALLTHLDKIALFENSLSGSLPTTLGALTNVTVLWLYQNSFTGEIPFQYLQTWTNLKEARLEDNRFSGAIGTEVGLLSSLELLHLHQNQLTNTIPTEVGIMTALKELYLQNNNLSGELPKELNASLALRLDGNGFEGTVPPNLCTVLWCDDCSSTNNNVSLVSTCSDLEEGALDWPGRFPRESQTNNGELWINILTDEFPGDTMWLWQRAGNGTSWKNVTGSNGALQASKHLHTYPLTLVPDSAYRFVVSDGYGDGFWRNGWITMILGTNATVIYAFGADGESSSFSEVVVVIEVASDGSPELSATVA